MEIANITVTDLGNGYFRLVPDEGYHLKLKSIERDTYYSEAVTKTPNKFIAVML